MRNLFEPITRDERQKEGVIKWIKSGCKATLEYPTGTGKTITAIKAIKQLLKKYPNFRTLVVVPTETLQEQWKKELAKFDILFNADVQIINTVIKHKWECDILVIDEIHRTGADEFSKVFTKVSYRCIIGLTATLERLDEKHTIIEKYCPVCDTITLAEALANKWVSDYTEYKVVLDVDDIDKYKEMNKEFQEHFSFFGFDFDLAMSMLGKEGFKRRLALRDKLCPNGSASDKAEMLKQITYHSTAMSRALQARKKFINTHPDKIRLTQEIIKHRPNAKIITFSATVEIAESIGIGHVYSGKDSKKKGRMTIEEFSNVETGVLNTVKKADEGLDVKGLSIAIILGMDSSPTRSTQRKGRVIRKEGDKHAEIFTFVINNTVESQWFEKSHKNDVNYITIGEKGLMQVLNGQEPEPYTRPIPKLTFRF